MARPKKTTTRPYGRQAEGKTIKSLSIETELLEKAEKEAEQHGMNFSEYISALLKGTLPPLLLLLAAIHAVRGGAEWSPESMFATVRLAGSFVVGLFS